MSDVVVEVLETADHYNPDADPPATPYDLLTLEEAKTFLAIADTSRDAQIQQWVTMSSQASAKEAGRAPEGFAKAKVRETWFCLEGNSLYTTRWPITYDEQSGLIDIESITENGTPVDPSAYVIEAEEGHIYKASGWATPVVIVYTGGYICPDEVPADLKYISALTVQEQRSQQQIASVAGIRMLSHKSARVMYHDPNRQQSRTTTGGSATQQAVKTLLANYTRFWA